jgi:hypothetical protein
MKNMNATDVKLGDLFTVLYQAHPTRGNAIGKLLTYDRDKLFEKPAFYHEVIVPQFAVVEITKAPWKKRSGLCIAWKAKLLEDQREYISSWCDFKEMTMRATPYVSKRRIFPIDHASHIYKGNINLKRPVKNIIHNLVFGLEDYTREKACEGYLPYRILCMDEVILEVPPKRNATY